MTVNAENSLFFPYKLKLYIFLNTLQVLCNSLWYVINQHMTINDAAARYKDVPPVPSAYEEFQGYNDLKRKKTKSQPLDCQSLQSHSQALYRYD